MERIFVDLAATRGPVKPMHAVNNGPIRSMSVQCRQNFPEWVEAGIPYARTHDSTLNHGYGGENTVDVDAVFPNFDADENDPASYDFPVTDKYLTTINDAGTEVFYRLGSTIEHWEKKYRVHPPKDFAKWARVCEHIIRHYTEGWADGFNYKMEYWEIWNEPDCAPATWTGTTEQFFEFFAVVASHLKSCFPHLKIGGPAIAYWKETAVKFLAYMHEHNVPLDFFSWHRYCSTPEAMSINADFYRRALDENGYPNAESICNEWNYVESWTENFDKSIDLIHSHRGSAFTAACLLTGQHTSIDMLMYYDAQPGIWNALFNYYTLRPEKTYYVFHAFNVLYRLGTSVKVACEGEGLHTAAARGEDGRTAVMIARFSETGGDVRIEIPGGAERYSVICTDEKRSGEKIGEFVPGDSLFVPDNSVILLQSL